MAEEQSKAQGLKLVKFILPAFIPIFYLQGYAFYCGTLEPYKLNDYLYPVATEQIFINTFYFYGSLVRSTKSFLFFTFFVFIFLLLISISVEAYRGQEKDTESVLKKKVVGFVKTHIEAFIMPGVLLLLLYISFFFSFFAYFPYSTGKSYSHGKISKIESEAKITKIEYEQYKKKIYGTVIFASPNNVSILTHDKNVITIPAKEINAISSMLKSEY